MTDAHVVGRGPRAHHDRSRVADAGRGRVVFIGAVHEAVPALHAVVSAPVADLVGVVTAPPGATTSGTVDLATPAARAGAPVIRTSDVNDPEVVDRVARLEPDLLVVAGWSRLLGPRLLELPRHGCVGFHASLLPRHRGRAPVNWSIILGETETGNTMMLLDSGVDTGGILDQERVPIGPDDTCGAVYDRVGAAGARMLARNLPALLRGDAGPAPQDPADGDVLPRRTPEMGVIDWTRSARQVHDWVRALTHPYPGAFTSLGGRRLHVWGTRDPRTGPGAMAPGTVRSASREGVRVATGDGGVTLSEVSVPGGRPEPASEWWNRHGFDGSQVVFDPVSPEESEWALGGDATAEVRGLTGRTAP